MLGKLTSLLGSKASKHSEPIAFGRDLPIIVRNSAIERAQEDPYALIQAVIDYVNTLLGQGNYVRLELPPLAIQAYHIVSRSGEQRRSFPIHSQCARQSGRDS